VVDIGKHLNPSLTFVGRPLWAILFTGNYLLLFFPRKRSSLLRKYCILCYNQFYSIRYKTETLTCEVRVSVYLIFVTKHLSTNLNTFAKLLICQRSLIYRMPFSNKNYTRNLNFTKVKSLYFYKIISRPWY
jgi:hypothetical protein